MSSFEDKLLATYHSFEVYQNREKYLESLSEIFLSYEQSYDFSACASADIGHVIRMLMDVEAVVEEVSRVASRDWRKLFNTRLTSEKYLDDARVHIFKLNQPPVAVFLYKLLNLFLSTQQGPFEYNTIIEGWRRKISDHLVILRSRQSERLVLSHPEKAFDATYVQDLYDLQDFFSSLHGLVNSTVSFPPGVEPEVSDEQGNFVAPYTTLIQSSCCGKSRFLMQLKSTNDTLALMVYVSCKDSEDVYPPVSSTWLKFIQNLKADGMYDATPKVSRFLVMMANEVLIKYFDRNSVLLDSKIPQSSIVLDDLMNDKIEFDSLADYESAKINLEEQLNELMTEDGKKVIICFAFDEASILIQEKVYSTPKIPDRNNPTDPQTVVGSSQSSLSAPQLVELSLFKVIRRALGELMDSKICLPSYFASTVSSMANLMPALEFENFARTDREPNEVTVTKPLLHRPLLLHGTFDIHFRDVNNISRIVSSSTSDWARTFLKSDRFFGNLLNYGRPMWKALSTVAPFLHAKISIPRDMNISRTSINVITQVKTLKNYRVFTLMVLGRTAFLTPLVHDQLYSEALINNQMAYLHSFNEKLGRSIVGFPSEPILSGRACVALKQHFCQLVDYFCGICSLVPTIDIGEHGEFMARLILVYAVQKTVPVANTFPNSRNRERDNDLLDRFAPRTLKSFLNSVRSDLFSKVDTSFDADDLVSFSHWMPMAQLGPAAKEVFMKDRDAFEVFLRDGLRRNCAFILPKYFAAVDLIIPVALQEPSRSGQTVVHGDDKGKEPLIEESDSESSQSSGRESFSGRETPSESSREMESGSDIWNEIFSGDSGRETPVSEDREPPRKRARVVKRNFKKCFKDPIDGNYISRASGVFELKKVKPLKYYECGAILVQVKNSILVDYKEVATSMNECWPTSRCVRVCINIYGRSPKLALAYGVIFIEGLSALDAFTGDEKSALKRLLNCYNRSNRLNVSVTKYNDYYLYSTYEEPQ